MPFLALVTLVACVEPVPPAKGTPAVDKLVVLVLDGVRVEDSFGEGVALDGAPTDEVLPTVREDLLPLAARVVPAVQTGVTTTAPGHCDLLAGRNVPHGHFNIAESTGAGDYVPEWPTLIQAFLAADPSRTALVTGDTPHTEGLVATLYPGADGVAQWENTASGGLATEDDAQVVDRLVQHLHADDPPDFVLVNLHAMDTRAHVEDEEGYLEAVRAADTYVMRVWKALQQDTDYADRTIFVVTTDHGRHSTGDTYWSDHGDVCTGCREVPIVLVGPGVKAGASVATSWALVDLAPTLAHLLGFSLPFGEGLVMEDLLDAPTGVATRAGTVDLEGAAAGVELLADPAHRSRVVVDGVELSSTDALDARGPTAAASLLCWREIAAAGEEYWPWVARCAEEGGAGWEPVVFPTTRVDPHWRPALGLVGEAVWAAWSENPGGGVAKDDDPPDPVPLARRVGGAWQSAATSGSGYYVTAPRLAAIDAGSAVLAWAASDNPARGRYTRKIRLHRVDWAADAEDATWSAETSFDLDDIGRQERPAIFAEGEDVRVAFLGYGDGTTALFATRSADGGATWEAPVRVSDSPRVLPHLAPVWDGVGRLWWGALDDDGQAVVCRIGEDDTASTPCEAVGSERIASLTAAGEGVRVAIDTGVGQWESISLE